MSAAPSFTDAFAIRRIETRGTAMRVAQIGSGPDIVWVPGGDSPAEAWLLQMNAFADRFRSTSYDPRGVGQTVSAPGPWSIADFARDCAGMIEQVCRPPVILTGLSMGALITQQVAIDFPHLVRLAIPMGTAAHVVGFTRDWMEAEIRLRKEGYQLPGYFLGPHFAAFSLPAKALADPAIWERAKAAYSSRWADRNPQDMIDQWQACLDFDCREALRTCPVPMHAIAFSEDLQTPPSAVKEVADLAPRGVFHEMPGLGHVSLIRHCPDIVNARIAEIIAAHG